MLYDLYGAKVTAYFGRLRLKEKWNEYGNTY